MRNPVDAALQVREEERMCERKARYRKNIVHSAPPLGFPRTAKLGRLAESGKR